MVMRILNCAKHLAFTQHYSIKEPYHFLFPYLPISDKKAEVLSLLWARRKFRLCKPWPVCGNTPASSPYHHKSQAISFFCSLKPFLNLLESLPCSPQKASLCNKFFSYSLGVCVISLDIQTEFWLKDPSCLCGVITTVGPVSRTSRCYPLPPGVFLLLLWLSNWLCCMLVNMHLGYCLMASLCF